MIFSFARLAGLLILTRCPSPALASQDSYLRSDDYAKGEYGDYVTQTFKTSPMVAAKPNMMLPFTACDDGSKLFVAPRGNAVKAHGQAKGMIYDSNGDFIWAPDESYGPVYNFQVQQYKNEPHLTFWTGDDGVKGHGQGVYHILNQHYDRVKTISAGNDLHADLHVFAITRDETVLCSSYNLTTTDLSPLNSSFGQRPIWDSIFQEISPETGQVLFEWRSLDHVDIRESYTDVNVTNNDPWDFFHINMVEKDDSGNYLVTSRHLRSVLYIDGGTGNVLWRLGGRNSSFHDASGGRAAEFVGQHDAHWADGNRVITLFDNRADWQVIVTGGSKGLRIALDYASMTASIDKTFEHPKLEISSDSQGSFQTLPNGNVVIGYGSHPIMSEFSPDGTLLCDAWWVPQSRLSKNDISSYQSLKANWTGKPRQPPAIAYLDNSFFVSWLGATEIVSWALYHSDDPDSGFELLMSGAKEGFETQFVMDPSQAINRYVFVVARDKRGTDVGRSQRMDMTGRAVAMEAVASAVPGVAPASALVSLVDAISKSVSGAAPHIKEEPLSKPLPDLETIRFERLKPVSQVPISTPMRLGSNAWRLPRRIVLLVAFGTLACLLYALCIRHVRRIVMRLALSTVEERVRSRAMTDVSEKWGFLDRSPSASSASSAQTARGESASLLPTHVD